MWVRSLAYPGGARAAPGGGAPAIEFTEPSYVRFGPSHHSAMAVKAV
jgi:hypothetical protein